MIISIRKILINQRMWRFSAGCLDKNNFHGRQAKASCRTLDPGKVHQAPEKDGFEVLEDMGIATCWSLNLSCAWSIGAPGRGSCSWIGSVVRSHHPYFEAGVELSAGRVGKAPGMGKQLNQRQMTDSSFFCDGKPPNHMAIEL